MIRRTIVVLAAAAALLAGCGDEDDAPPPAPAPTADDALVVRLTTHQDVAERLATVAERKAERADLRRLARTIRRNREQWRERFSERRADIVARDPEGRRELPDIGVTAEQAAEDVTPAALNGVTPFDTAFLALMDRHDAGAIALLRAGEERATSAETRTLARRLRIAYERERERIRREIAAVAPTG